LKTDYPTLSRGTLLFLQQKGGLIGKFGEAAALNETASQILELCDGNRTKEDIAQIVSSKYDEDYDRALRLIIEFLSVAVDKGHVVINPYPQEMLGVIRGNRGCDVPMHVTMELTSRCSLHCIHCYANAGPDKEIINIDKALNLIMKIRELGVVKITLTGGDPLIHPEFLKILECCCGNFLSVDVATNGYLVNEQMAKKMSEVKKIGTLKCNISIDGTESTHDYIRGVTGSWKRAVEAIKLLRKYKISTTVAMTLNPYNVQEVEDVILTARENGANKFAVGMTVEQGRALGRGLLLTKEQIADVHDRLSWLAEKYKTERFSIETRIEGFDHEAVSEESKNVSCGAGNEFCFIDLMGNLKPCGMMDFIVGNVNQGALTDIYRSTLMSAFFKIERPSKNICGDCDNLYFCDGCIANAILRARRTKTCSWLQYWVNLNHAIVT